MSTTLTPNTLPEGELDRLKFELDQQGINSSWPVMLALGLDRKLVFSRPAKHRHVRQCLHCVEFIELHGKVADIWGTARSTSVWRSSPKDAPEVHALDLFL